MHKVLLTISFLFLPLLIKADSSLTGTWILRESAGTPTKTDNYKWILAENNSFTLSIGSLKGTGNWSIKGKKFSFSCTYPDGDIDSQNYDIVSIDDNKLIVQQWGVLTYIFERAAKPLMKEDAISVIKICSDYEGNELKADRLYLNKELYIEGIVDEITKDLDGDYYIRIDGNPDATVSYIRCYFNKSNLESIADLSKGDLVKIKGKCDGALMFCVVLKNCKIM